MNKFNSVALELSAANEYVDTLHRHHHSVHRDKYRVGAEINGRLDAVCIGRIYRVSLEQLEAFESKK